MHQSQKKRTYISPGIILLVASFILVFFFSYWIYNKTEKDIARDFYYQNDRLLLQKKYREVQKLQKDIFTQLGDSPLDDVWWKLVVMQSDVSFKLEGYVRLLRKNPDREASYQEIAYIMDEINDDESKFDKKQYLQELNEVPSIRKDFLETYNLLVK